jgi:hypothetical protein
LAIVLARIAHPPAEPVQPQVRSAAQLAPEHRGHSRTGFTAKSQPGRDGQPAGDVREEIR